MIQAFIGEFYKYPAEKQKFRLIESNGFVYRFECGHWCTDCVFEDLIRCKTGKANFLMQLELIFK